VQSGCRRLCQFVLGLAWLPAMFRRHKLDPKLAKMMIEMLVHQRSPLVGR
jgi:hypothetical protein